MIPLKIRSIFTTIREDFGNLPSLIGCTSPHLSIFAGLISPSDPSRSYFIRTPPPRPKSDLHFFDLAVHNSISNRRIHFWRRDNSIYSKSNLHPKVEPRRREKLSPSPHPCQKGKYLIWQRRTPAS